MVLCLLDSFFPRMYMSIGSQLLADSLDSIHRVPVFGIMAHTLALGMCCADILMFHSCSYTTNTDRHYIAYRSHGILFPKCICQRTVWSYVSHYTLDSIRRAIWFALITDIEALDTPFSCKSNAYSNKNISNTDLHSESPHVHPTPLDHSNSNLKRGKTVRYWFCSWCEIQAKRIQGGYHQSFNHYHFKCKNIVKYSRTAYSSIRFLDVFFFARSGCHSIIACVVSELRMIFEAELKKTQTIIQHSFIGHHPNEKQLHILSLGWGILFHRIVIDLSPVLVHLFSKKKKNCHDECVPSKNPHRMVRFAMIKIKSF